MVRDRFAASRLAARQDPESAATIAESMPPI
jgi:hypothetical protein